MQNTCCEQKCAFLQSGMVKTVEECPNFQETLWTTDKESTPLLVRDCCPKRQLIMMQEIHNRVFAVQQTQTEQRNAASALAEAITKVEKNKAIEGESDARSRAIPNK